MRKLIFIGLLLAFNGCSSDSNEDPIRVSPGLTMAVDLSGTWVESTAASEGVGDLTMAVTMAEAHPRLKSLVIVRNGKLIAEHYFDDASATTLHDVRSVTKSLVSALVGIALEQGSIHSLDDQIGPYLLDAGISLTSEQQQITIRHLLTMSGGFQWPENGGNAYSDWILSGRPIGYLLEQPMVATPGSAFNYNSAGTHLLAQVLKGAVGQDLETYANERLFSKLGITAYTWEILADGTANGGAGIDLLPRDLAKIGQLYLQEGKSGDSSIVPSTWVTASVMPQYPWRSDYGVLKKYTYGFQWWVREKNSDQDGAFLAWGHGGQFIFVVPEKDLVIVTTVDWRNSADAGGADALTMEALEVIINGVLPQVN